MASSNPTNQSVAIADVAVVDEPARAPDGCPRAYRAARQEIERLSLGEALLYHEGLLATDAALDPTIAGWAAAFRDAALERDEGVLVQRRLRDRWYQYLFRRSCR